MGNGLVVFGWVLALASVMAFVLGPLGTRAGWWTFREGFVLLRWCAYLGLAAAAASLVGGLLTRRWLLSAAAIAIGLAVAAVPWQLYRGARQVPPIHDITTDINDPPAFVAVAPLRAGAPNGPEYDGPSVAAQQQRGYPDIKPLILPVPAATAFDRALAAARGMGWEIVASVPAEGRIEATATTRWFGFKDDVVIRVREEAQGSRIDVRSKSRVGVSDVGTNAKRIREFVERVERAT